MAVEPLDLSLEQHTGDRLGIEPIPLVRRTVVAFIGRTERGPLNEPVTLEDFEQFRATFGGHCGFSFVSHAVQHYFAHGGQAAVLVRVANRATRARIDLPAQGQFLYLQARHPGGHEFLRASVDYDGLQTEPERFNLVIQRLRGPGSTLIADQEIHSRVSMRHSDQRFIVDALQDSKLVRLSGPLPGNRPDATVANFSGQPIPYIPLTEAGADGEELTDYDVIGSNQEGTGLFALERGGFDLLCIPASPSADLGTTAFVAAERFCERQRAILICDPPASWTSVHAAVIGMRSTSRLSRNAMTYFPRIRARGEGSRFSTGIPACGAVAGLLARQDSSGVWAAITTGTLKASLTPTNVLNGGDAALLKRFGVNALTHIGGGNAALIGNVTLGGSSAFSKFWQRLDRRRLLLLILKSIDEATRWVPQGLDADAAVPELDRQVRTFLTGLFERGALAGSTWAQAFFVEAHGDARTEPALTLRYGVALHNPSEFVVYEVHYRRDGTTTRQLPALEAEQLLL
jgi:uncharacterized protein